MCNFLPWDNWDLSEEEKCVAIRAAQALVDGMKRNFCLRQLELDEKEEWQPLIQSYLDDVEFYLDLNRKGRYLLRDQHHHDMTPSLWPSILAYSNNNVSRLYYFLREQPWLVPARY